LVENMMLARGMFIPGWSDEEVERFKPVFREEIGKLRAFGVVGGRARIEMLAAVGVAWK